MSKTGNYFIDSFSLAVVFFPLLPVIVVLFRKIYHRDVLNYLMILCLLNFVNNLNLQLLQVTAISRFSATHVFSLLEMVVLIQLFKTGLKKSYREFINILTIAFLSAVVTYYFMKGANQRMSLLDGIQDAWIILLAAISLVNIVRNNYLQIFYSSLFWIAAGTLFYFLIAMLLDSVEGSFLPSQHAAAMDKIILLDIAAVARYLFYLIAAWIYNKPLKPDPGI
jgi:hypothetical protein